MKKDIQYRNIIINMMKGKNITLTILMLKKYFSYQEYHYCLNILFKNSQFKRRLLTYSKIENYAELISEGMFPMLFKKNEVVDMKRQVKEFEFMCSYLKVSEKKLKKFNFLREKFENELLWGNFERAEEHLDQIEKIFGKSFWYIEEKMFLLQACNKKKSFYTFYNGVKKATEHEIINTYVRIIQRKVKFDISNGEYKKFVKGQLKQLLDKYADEQEMLSYMEFMAFYNLEDISEEDFMLQHLLTIFQHLSLIDQYLLFKKMEMNLRIQDREGNPNKKEIEIMLNVAGNVRKCLEDSPCFLEQVDFSWGANISVDYIKEHIDTDFEIIAKELFLEEKYDACINYCRKELKENVQFVKIQLLVQAYVASNTDLEMLPEHTMFDILVKRMCKMYVKISDLSQIEMWQELPRFFMSFHFGIELLEFVYNRLYALSEFDAIKCACASVYNRRYLSIEHMVLLDSKDRNGFLDAWERAVGKCISCNWSECSRKIMKKYGNICLDQISNKLCGIAWEEKEDRELRIKDFRKVINNIEVFFREEYCVFIFNEAIERKEYMVAFEIYVNLFFISKLSVTRMDTKKLNKRLHYGNCRPFYKELDFAVYACNTELHYTEKNLTSEYVRNSFLQSWKMSYFLHNICDLKMLNVKGLYGLEAIDERKKILRIIWGKYDCENEMKGLNEEEIRMSMTFDDAESMQMKAICANWINIPDNGFVMSAMQEIKNYSSADNMKGRNIQDQWQYTVFRELILKCKDLYIEAVNEKLGTTIRHCILERLMLENLISYSVYIKKEAYNLKDIIQKFPILEQYEENIRAKILKCLSRFFDKFFLTIDTVRRKIYFTESEDEEKVRFHVPGGVIEKGAEKMSKVSNDSELHELVMRVLNGYLDERINFMGDYVVREIQKGYKIEYSRLIDEFKEYPEMKNYLDTLDEAVKYGLKQIRQQFEVTYNENEEHFLSSYVDLITNKFSYALIQNLCDTHMKVRNGIVWNIDIILKYCIENVEKHVKMPIEEAGINFIIREAGDNAIEFIFRNQLSSDIDRQELRDKIGEINRNIKQKAYIGMRTKDDEHGLGYYRIARFMHNNLKVPWNLKLFLEDDIFSTIVFLGLGE